MVFYFWNSPKWNIYITAGGMAEKGLRSIYNQDMYKNDSKYSTLSEKGSVSKIQWSLNASIGASYTFYDKMSLYVEPKFSHYFDNDQPVSIRTEKKQVFGISGGFRYQF